MGYAGLGHFALLGKLQGSIGESCRQVVAVPTTQRLGAYRLYG